MRSLPLTKAGIIGVLILLLGGCSAWKLGYNNGPQLAWWWLDGYLDFSREQTPRAKQAIERWFEWHRRTQLGDYAGLLAAAQPQIGEPMTAAQVCRWQAQGRELLQPALERALQQGAELVPGLGEAQLRHLEAHHADKNKDMQRDFLQPKLEDRRKAAVKRARERAEMLYGDIDEAQVRVIAAGVAASPFDPQALLAERERRQKDTVQTLRRLLAERADPAKTVAALRELVERTEQSPDPAYRAYQQRLADYNCAFSAQVHNATTAAQRQAARDRLKGWEADLREMREQRATAAPPQSQ